MSLLANILLAVLGSTAVGSPLFEGLGDLPGDAYYDSEAWGVSGNGQTIVGRGKKGVGLDTWDAFYYTSGSLALVPLGAETQVALDASYDGSVIVGFNYASPEGDAFRWHNVTGMELLPRAPGVNVASAHGVSPDGSVVVGTQRIVNQHFRDRHAACRWDALGYDILPYSGFQSYAEKVTLVGDEEIIVGVDWLGNPNSDGTRQAVIWRNGAMQGLGDLPGGRYASGAFDVSANGKVVVGYGCSAQSESGAGIEAFRWTAGEGMKGLGAVSDFYFGSVANAVSGNGMVIVGDSYVSYSTEAMVWTPAAGMQNLKTVLTQGFGQNLNGWTLTTATDVSDDGFTIVGYGDNPAGKNEAFRARLQQQIYINWDDGPSTGFFVTTDAKTGEKYTVTVEGSTPALVWPDELPNGQSSEEYKTQVINEIKAMFQRSDLQIDILDSRTVSKFNHQAALEVRFAADTEYAHVGPNLYGIAWDIAPKGMGGCDRFNARWDGEVAVFQMSAFNPATGETKPPRYLAETIAHEVGHGLGLRHVDPWDEDDWEIMDYGWHENDNAEFMDIVSPIKEPPTTAGKETDKTHNPAYHLMRYVMGERNANVHPGTYDLGSITILGYEITSFSYDGTLYNLTAGSPGGTLGENWFNLAQARDVDPTSETLEFFAYDDDPVRIFASTEAGHTWDLYFGTGTADAPDLIFEDLGVGALAGSIFRYDLDTQSYEIVGSFSGSATSVMELSGDPVPEPGMLVMLLAGFAALLAYTWRRRRW